MKNVRFDRPFLKDKITGSVECFLISRRPFRFFLAALIPFTLHAGPLDGEVDQEAYQSEPFVDEAEFQANLFDQLADQIGQSSYEIDRNLPSPSQTKMENGIAFPSQSGFFGCAEFLWWRLDEASLDYASVNRNNTALNATINLVVGTVHKLIPQINPGFRVGAGYRFSKELWELGGFYTFYHTKDSDHVNCIECRTNVATMPYLNSLMGNNLDALIAAKANMSFWYHIGDIELAKPLALDEYTSCRLVVGPTVAFIEQKFKVTYFDNTNTFTSCPTQQAKYDIKWKFSGAGIRFGADSRWNVFNRINLLFGAYVSAVYGNYKNRWNANHFIDPTGLICPEGANTPLIKEPYARANFSNHRVAFSSRLFGGIGYNYAFKAFSIEIYANYEINSWFNLTDQYRIEGEQDNIDTTRILQTPPLNLSGLDVGFKLNF